MVNVDLAIKDIVLLYQNENKSKEEVAKLLNSFEKDDFIEYILDDEVEDDGEDGSFNFGND
jgi:hypothetical protein